MGDIHQPLHSTSRFTDEFVNGDKGGNLVKAFFQGEHTITNLHSVWDSCWMRLPADYEGSVAPITDEFFDVVHERSVTMMEDFPYSYLEQEAKTLDPHTILEESHALAVSTVYRNVGEGEFIPSWPEISEGQKICGRRIALGGYRLANLLIELFND